MAVVPGDRLPAVEGFLGVLNSGRATGANKFGLLLALLDVAPRINPQSGVVTGDDLAEKMIELHWDHADAFADGTPLRQLNSRYRVNTQVILQVVYLRRMVPGPRGQQAGY